MLAERVIVPTFENLCLPPRGECQQRTCSFSASPFLTSISYPPGKDCGHSRSRPTQRAACRLHSHLLAYYVQTGML